MDETEVADELYGVPPQDFIRVRDARAEEARTGGDRELAASIKRLRRPTMSAWALNALVRRRPEEIASLLALGAQLREAQAKRSGAELRELGRRRKELVTALGRQAREVAAELGHPLSAAAEAEVLQTLHTALVDPAAAHTVRSGRMSAPLSYSGLGPLGGLASSGPPAPSASSAPATSAPVPVTPQPSSPPTLTAVATSADLEQARRRGSQGPPAIRRRVEEDRQERELERARTALGDAEHDAAEAAVALRDAETRMQRAVARREDLEQRIQRTTEQLRGLEEQAMHATRDAREARHARDFANRVAQAAQGVLARARDELERLER